MVRVKVCCISSVEELHTAVLAGADALGFVAGMQTPAGTLDDDRIRALMAVTPPGVSRFLLTPALDPAAILAHVARTGADVVQVCDHVDEQVLEEVRRHAGVRIVAVVHAVAPDMEGYAAEAARHAHALLLDSGVPGADFEALGGTGRTHDWDRAAAVVASCPVPVWLAGGLSPENVRAAIRKVRPWGVDLCTGIRTEGRLDALKTTAFFDAVARST